MNFELMLTIAMAIILAQAALALADLIVWLLIGVLALGALALGLVYLWRDFCAYPLTWLGMGGFLSAMLGLYFYAEYCPDAWLWRLIARFHREHRL